MINKKFSIEDEFMKEIISLSNIIDDYPFENKKYYGYFLNQQYFLIRHTTRLIALAASVIDTNSSEDFRWWTEHLHEEIDHDQLILQDMDAIGYSGRDECEPVIRGLSLALFEDIRRHGENAILGYALMLEGLSMKRCHIVTERVKDTYGTGYSYLNIHATADEKHFPEGIARLENFSVSSKSIVIDNLHMSACLYRSFLMTIIHLKH